MQSLRCQDRHVGAVVGENKGNYKLPKAAKSRIQLGPRRSHIPRTSSQGSLWTLNRILCAAPAEGQEEETKRASRDPMHRCEVRRIQGDIIRGARDTSQKEAEATALRFKKEDHRKQISRNRKQISRNRKQKGVIIQGQIPERSWQNPAVLEFCSCTSHRDGSIILEACTHLELSKATWKRLQVPTRQITCWVQNRSTMARAPSLKALARRDQGYLSSCSSGVGSQGARRRRRRWRLRFCGDAARGGRAANSGGLMHALRQRRG